LFTDSTRQKPVVRSDKKKEPVSLDGLRNKKRARTYSISYLNSKLALSSARKSSNESNVSSMKSLKTKSQLKVI